MFLISVFPVHTSASLSVLFSAFLNSFALYGLTLIPLLLFGVDDFQHRLPHGAQSFFVDVCEVVVHGMPGCAESVPVLAAGDYIDAWDA